MAERTGLIFLGLVVEAGDGRSGLPGCGGVTFEAEKIDLAALEKLGIGGAVRGMASAATLGAHHGVLDGVRTGLAGVAFKTDGVARSARTDLAKIEGAVWIVAITASDQAFIHSVVDRPGEIRLDGKVAGKTKQGFGRPQERPLDGGLVDRVTIRAADIILPVR